MVVYIHTIMINYAQRLVVVNRYGKFTDFTDGPDAAAKFNAGLPQNPVEGTNARVGGTFFVFHNGQWWYRIVSESENKKFINEE